MHKHKTKVLIAISILVLAGLFSNCKQNKDEFKPEVQYFSQYQLDSILLVTVGDTSAIQNLGTPSTLNKGEGDEAYLIIKRTVDGYVELHEQWDDIVIIRSGHGILRTGQKVSDNKLWNGEKPWRNWYGGKINDVREYKISPGDFIIIPAMTAHQYIPEKNDTLTYWTIKIKRTRKE